jgi:Helix-turn-helix domain
MTERQSPHLELARTPKQLTGPPVFMTVIEAAAFLRISPVTLGRWRIEGHGPPFCKFGKRVLYECGDVIAWANTRKRLSTSEPDHRARVRG